MKTRILLVVLLLAISGGIGVALFLPDNTTHTESGLPSSGSHAAERDSTARESLMTPPGEPATEHLSSTAPRSPLARSSENVRATEPLDIAFVDIHVTARENGRPLEGSSVVLRGDEANGVWRDVGTNEAKLGQSVRVGPDGLAHFRVPPHASYHAVATGDQRTKGIRPDSQDANVRPLEPGEHITIDVSLRTTPNMPFFGRLVAAENGAPLAGGTAALIGHHQGLEYHPSSETSSAIPRVSPHDANEHDDWPIATATADSMGLFELDGASWAQHLARINVPGRSLIVVNMTAGHETAESALPIRLARTATVVASVTDGVGLPLNRVTVRMMFRSTYKAWAIRTSAYNPAYPEWGALTDTKGECRIDDLPSDVALAFELISGDQVDPHVDEALVLKGGEERRLDLRFGGRASLNGVLVDLEEKPLEDEAVWLRHADRTQRGQFAPSDKAFAKTRTDGQGRFSFDKLSAGDWWVGPAARTMTLPSLEVSRTLAPIAELVHVPSTGSVNVIVHTARGLSIRGHVVGPGGEPISDASVVASMAGTQIHLYATSNGDGSFLLGPLVGGEYELTARAGMTVQYSPSDASKAESLAPSGVMRAKAGEQYVILVLRQGGAIRCTLQCDEGFADAGLIETSLRDADGKIVGGVDRSVPCSNLAPGIYSAFAFSTKGKSAVRAGIEVRPGETTDALLVLRTGAKLRVKRGVDAPGTDDEYQVLFDGVRVAGGRLDSSQSVEHVVPAGHLVLRKRVGPNPWSEDALDVEAGETRDVVLRP